MDLKTRIPADRLKALVIAGLNWPERRWVWLLIGGLALGLEIFSYVFFQAFLRLRPCELCVYIRFSMVVIFLGSLVVAIAPRRLPFRIGGGLIILWGLVRGLAWDIKLEHIYRQTEAAQGFALCSPTTASFPFGLPLDRWLPTHFAPTAMCGEDSWGLFGLNMAEWLLPVYVFFFIAYAVLFAHRWLAGLVSAKPR